MRLVRIHERVFVGGRSLLAVAVAGCVLALPYPLAEIPTSASAQRITATALKAHVMALADDALEGRGAGYRGEKKATRYIADVFRKVGLATTQQRFRFFPKAPERVGVTLTSRNVLALLPGSDARYEREVIVVGAHHDGQGQAGQADPGRFPATDSAASSDTIWNSADDNASSVAVILEIASALNRKASRPRRTIVFATFGAEEHALNGSAHLAQNPWPAGSRVVAMLNLEKLGRVPDHPVIMAGCATSAGWTQVMTEAAARSGQNVECILPELIADTDHYPFGALGIPAVVLGIAHEEDTHRPTDEAARVDYDALARRADYILDFVEILANREPPPAFNSNVDRGPGLVAVVASEAERASLGLGDHGALRLGVVLPGLPAALAGLKVGDYVTALDDAPLEAQPNDRLIQETLAEKSVATLTVRRGGASLRVSLRSVRR